MANGKTVFEEVATLLGKDGEVRLTIQQRDRLLLAAIIDLNKQVEDLRHSLNCGAQLKRIERLENTNLVLLAGKYPKRAIVLGMLVYFLLNLPFWLNNQGLTALFAVLGLPTAIIPTVPVP